MILSVYVSGQDVLVDTVIEKQSIFKDKRLSTEVMTYYPYYFIHSPDWLYSERLWYKNSFNFGASVVISKYFGYLKLGCGISYATCNFKHYLTTSSVIINDKIQYINYNFNLGIDLKQFQPLVSILINQPFSYNQKMNQQLINEIHLLSFHPSPGGGSSNATPDSLNIRFGKSVSFIIACQYKININKNIRFFNEL